MFHLPSIYPITDTRISGLTHIEQVSRLIDGGATLIQLREKKASSREFYAEALECVAYAHPRRVRIVINDRADIALAVSADGVHLGQDDMPPAAARELLGPNAIIGYSTHSVEQGVAAIDFPVDYVAIGPVFPTSTKENPDPVVGLKGVASVRGSIGAKPLVAIGGIDEFRISEVLAAGADAVAMIGTILADPTAISATMRRLQEKLLLNSEQK
ncbi:MAG TPA: thiamine phosphate synthase [Pyrinomonadaceae bacterium]|nr:thiamine phosphate synthase [Pyrinomonadaceae bacterium]